MKEEIIKSAFLKAKNDINNLYNEIIYLKAELNEIKSILNNLTLINHKTESLLNKTKSINSTDNSTVPWEIEGLKNPNNNPSIGNEGVSTDRQTFKQTDRQRVDLNKNLELEIHEASKILRSLDSLKKEIKFKFKQVTPQEMAVFSSIYQLEEQKNNPPTYSEIASNLNLSQSSIRDYVQRMINKGIPIKKQKINNKKILLSISEDLKKIATLSTIIELRGL